MKKIRVLVVDDSLVFRSAIQTGLIKDSELQIVATAQDAFDAKEKLRQFQPDVMTLDVEMPKVSGIEFLREVMQESPMPVVMVSGVSGIVFEAMQAGAVDFVAKPGIPSTPEKLRDFYEDLADKIKIAYRANLMRAIRATKPKIEAAKTTIPTILAPAAQLDGLVAIGASTGGTEATAQILKSLSKEMPGILVVQHMPPMFTKIYAERLNRECALNIAEATDGEVVRPGRVLIAPGDKQMTVRKEGGKYVVHCKMGDKVSGHCPSVDVLFRSVAKAYGSKAAGILLTGMGKDGAQGLKEMREHGAYTIGQDEASSVVYGMPKVAFDIGAVTQQASIENIAPTLMNHLK